ncbi:MAG: hypothetical protein IPM54_17915 [Polyangiaceae bacterium]|nr:hypothetical protein [Polyangiaceae bacterium]
MKKVSIVIAVAFLFTGAGCRPREKQKTRYDAIDGGYVLRKECYRPVDDCWTDCENRNAGRTCIDCCRDQEFLCDTQQKFSFESCKSAQ